MDVVVFAVELAQLDLEVRAHVSHDLLATGQHRVGEHSTPVFRDENQMRVEVVNDMTPSSDIGIGVPPR